MLKRSLLLTGIGISVILIWFAIGNYRASRMLAEENLRGLALSLATAIDNSAVRDPSFQTLAGFRPADIAFFAIIDNKGVYRFHSNGDLIGTPTESSNYKEVLTSQSLSESRITLGTGETVYECYTPLFLSGDTMALRLVLHTYRADAVVRRARLSMMILLALVLAGWVLGAVIFRFAFREEQHQVEMERRERLAQLGEMGAMLAHEIRNPLAGIKGYSQLIEKNPQEARNAGFARRITAEVLRLETLVNDLLLYARSDSFPMDSINLNQLISYSLSFIRHEAEQQKVEVLSEGDENLEAVGNRDRLGQVLLNLAKNAVQAMPDGGILHITAKASGKNVIITISDSGQGINPEDFNRIFEPFFTTKARGTGLGLALCKKIIEEHKGEIRVDSTRGKGTSVSIALPRMKSVTSRGTHA